MINRYTWYSNDGKTRKKIDYVLFENFIQKYVSDCCIEPEFDFDSDHRRLKTTLRTPYTRRARRTVKRQPRKSQPDIKAFDDDDIRAQYKQTLENNLKSSNAYSQESPTGISKKILAYVRVKNKVRWLKNKKLELEANALNTFANKRQVDELFRRLKSDNSTFLDTNRNQKCD